MAFLDEFSDVMNQAVTLKRAGSVDAYNKPTFTSETLSDWRFVEQFERVTDEQGREVTSGAHAWGPVPANGVPEYDDRLVDPDSNERPIVRVQRLPDVDGSYSHVKVWLQ